jgi:hypothetical protein
VTPDRDRVERHARALYEPYYSRGSDAMRTQMLKEAEADLRESEPTAAQIERYAVHLYGDDYTTARWSDWYRKSLRDEAEERLRAAFDIVRIAGAP